LDNPPLAGHILDTDFVYGIFGKGFSSDPRGKVFPGAGRGFSGLRVMVFPGAGRGFSERASRGYGFPLYLQLEVPHA
jgi:hypothetical protein